MSQPAIDATTLNGLTFSSAFDSGNATRVEALSDTANDEFILSDWNRANLQPSLTGYWYSSEQVTEPLLKQLPSSQPSIAEKRGWLGSCKQIKPSDTANAQRVKAMRHQGLIPEYFAAGHDSWLLSVITHPQMVALQQLLLNSAEVRFQHNNLLTRSQGNSGSRWHCHRLHQPHEDDAGPTSTPSPLGVVLNLCYPDGFGAGDGGLKVIPGSHLYRNGSSMEGSQDDDSLRAGWLRGKRHPITGEPLAITELSVGPGTIISLLSHGAHAVTKKRDPGTRLGTIFGFRKPDPDCKIVTGMIELPANWQRKRDDGELSPELTKMLHLF